MEGVACIYNMLIIIVMFFCQPVDKDVENREDKVWGQGC